MQTGFPLWAEWTVAIIGAVAFLMAVPSLLQMYFGRPKIHVEFRFYEDELNRYLVCEIYNLFVTRRLLKLLGVRRSTAEDVHGLVSITEEGTKRIILADDPAAIVQQRRQFGYRVSIPASFQPHSIGLIGQTKSDRSVEIMHETKRRPIAAGFYIAHVKIIETDNVIEASTKFEVGEKPSLQTSGEAHDPAPEVHP